ncbi:MAG: hypothetical protein J6T57_03980 [Alphaproteobacteria bacterium]|nr:hypothetical protein [Alphaproteobacteria bacterium]
MKKVLLYPLYGSVLIGTAGARTYYMDLNGACQQGVLCLTNPGNNACCPTAKTVDTIDTSAYASSGQVFRGLEINGETIVDADGNINTNLTTGTKNLIKNAKTSNTTARKIATVKTVAQSDMRNVKFNMRDGKGLTTKSFAVGDTLPEPEQKQRLFDGAVFSGWTTSNGTSVTKISESMNDGDTIYAQYGCGKGLGQNKFGVCVPNKGGGNGDVYIDDDGNEIPLEEVDCGYLNNSTNNNSYCDRTVIVHLHDQPTTTNLNVTNGNEGRTLWCNRVWCYEPYWGQQDGQNGPNADAGALVETINMPHLNGYKFRGYFYRSGKLMDDLVVDSTHNADPNDVASGHFYPKNTSDTVSWMGIYSPQDGINIWWDFEDNSTSIQGLPIVTQGPLSGAPGLRMHEIDIYGGWARECAPGTNATCTLEKGISVAHSGNGLKPGQVRYDNGCNGYNHLYGNVNAYNPTCESDSGNISLNYTFTDQYSVPVNCSPAVTQSCATGSGHNLLSNTGFNNACGDGYQLRWLKTNDKWYSPGRNVSCSTNVFGQSSATVYGYVCRECVAPANGTCVNMPANNAIQYNVSGNQAYNGQLWGANSGYVNPDACRKVQCNQGFDLQVNSVTGVISCVEQCGEGLVPVTNDVTGEHECITPYQQCMLSCQKETAITDCETYCGGQTFQCPNNFTTPSGITYTVVKGAGVECTYTAGCSTSNAVLEGNATIYCNGNDGSEPCTSAWLAGQFANLNCFACPNVNAAPTGVSPHVPTQEGLNCTYKASCNNPAYTLYYGDDAVGTQNQMNCTGSAGCIVQNITNWYGNHSCMAGGTPPTFTCPSMFNVPTGVKIVDGPDRNGSQCTYTLGCTSSGYTLNGTNPVVCSGSAACTSTNLANMVSGYSCSASAGEFTCASPSQIDGITMNYTQTSQNGQCAYKAQCTDASAICSGNVVSSGQNKPVNLCEQQVCSGAANCQTLAGLYTAANISCIATGNSYYSEIVLPDDVTIAEMGSDSSSN